MLLTLIVARWVTEDTPVERANHADRFRTIVSMSEFHEIKGG